MSTACNRNQVLNFSVYLNEELISFDANTAFKLLNSKLQNISSTQNNSHLSNISELVKNKNISSFQKLNFASHEISDYIDNAEEYLVSIEQSTKNEADEIALISRRLNELQMLITLKKQIDEMENYCLQTIFYENKNLFIFHAKKQAILIPSKKAK